MDIDLTERRIVGISEQMINTCGELDKVIAYTGDQAADLRASAQREWSLWRNEIQQATGSTVEDLVCELRLRARDDFVRFAQVLDREDLLQVVGNPHEAPVLDEATQEIQGMIALGIGRARIALGIEDSQIGALGEGVPSETEDLKALAAHLEYIAALQTQLRARGVDIPKDAGLNWYRTGIELRKSDIFAA